MSPVLSEADQKGETVVLLLVHQRNRELLSEWLSRHFTVETPTDGALPDSFDLCLFDLVTLRKYHGELERRKAESTPVFLPYLMVMRERERSQLSDDIWDLIDDRVIIPTSQAELGARVSTLLTARWQSLELQELREHEVGTAHAFTESALRAMPDIFYVFDTDLELMRWNDRLAAVAGHSSDELDGFDLTDLVVEDDREALENAFETVLVGGGTVRVESTLVTEDGSEVPYEFTAARLTDPDGECLGIVGVGRDVTDRAVRRELARQNERLERFASIVSHDLRNPLTVANLNLDLGRETGDDEYFEKVERALTRMNDLIEDVLALARKGQVVGEAEPVSLRTAAETAWSSVQTDGATLEVADGQLLLMADDSRLHDMLMNLFRNSVEHGDGTVTVTVGPIDRFGFYVADDGQGIPEKEREKVFEYGYSTSEEGTGFGLAIVRSIAEAHGWQVDLGESETGGVRFEVTDVEFANGGDLPSADDVEGEPGDDEPEETAPRDIRHASDGGDDEEGDDGADATGDDAPVEDAAGP
ncbi:two-component system sensor histidine kinase NtrB [Haloarchaeobius amylolyticus]|uniref:two-component system sensor histidine kinase NtrB n=1 Tax=Haloarchaeobius amylolyticus TaxID=1198296 RepID=UPI0022713F3E|nr:PAS domain-containing sensor histidine kinase [Haloarchaeobius amylolyticus]